MLIWRNYSSLLGLESGEGLDLEELDGGVELLLGLLVLVLGSGDSNSDESWDISATFGLDKSIQLGINSDILNNQKMGL